MVILPLCRDAVGVFWAGGRDLDSIDNSRTRGIYKKTKGRQMTATSISIETKKRQTEKTTIKRSRKKKNKKEKAIRTLQATN